MSSFDMKVVIVRHDAERPMLSARLAAIPESATDAQLEMHTRESFVTVERVRRAGRLDAAAGCEYVDDRIRLTD